MRDLHLLVGGMGCRHCVREVTARLRDVPGVERVVADASTNRVRLTGSMSRTDVLARSVRHHLRRSCRRRPACGGTGSLTPRATPARDRAGTARGQRHP